jgi:hypothetical protein
MIVQENIEKAMSRINIANAIPLMWVIRSKRVFPNGVASGDCRRMIAE